MRKYLIRFAVSLCPSFFKRNCVSVHFNITMITFGLVLVPSKYYRPLWTNKYSAYFLSLVSENFPAFFLHNLIILLAIMAILQFLTAPADDSNQVLPGLTWLFLFVEYKYYWILVNYRNYNKLWYNLYLVVSFINSYYRVIILFLPKRKFFNSHTQNLTHFRGKKNKILLSRIRK